MSYPDPVLYEGTLKLIKTSEIDWAPVYNPVPGETVHLNGTETVKYHTQNSSAVTSETSAMP